MGSVYLLYRPMSVFTLLASFFGLVGVAIGVRFLYYYFGGTGTGHVQSLLLAVICNLIAAQLAVTGLLAHLIGHSRRLLEDVLWRVRRMELGERETRHLPADSRVPAAPGSTGRLMASMARSREDRRPTGAAD